MKSAAHWAPAILVLTLLLGHAPAPATDVAELPLKASVLAKPNLIIGFDDSGSMDLEVMLNSNDGVFFWDANNGTGWDAAGNFHRRIGGNANSQWRRYIYLFNNPQAAANNGANLKPTADWSDYTLPPTSELASMRSSAWNPQYYDPAVTYQPWGPALGYPAATFPNANPNAARNHPLYGGATNTLNLIASVAANRNANRYFVAARGMKLPQGAEYRECDDGNGGNCSNWSTVTTANRDAHTSKTTHLAMSYWPATYWVPAVGAWSCTVNASESVAVRNCANAPDGSRLRRIEIRSGVTSYPSTRGYAAELQNFANWYQYHRKRRLSANAAMSQVLENVNGLNMGIIRMNALPATGTRVTMNDLDSADPTKNAMSILKFVYEIDQNVATPTRQTLLRIGQEFAAAGGPVKYACQRNAAMIVTDGYANVANTTPPSYSQSTYGSGAPYATTYGNTLADIALSYYTNPLRPGTVFALGRVPTSKTDPNPNLHMNTYGLTLGAKGNLYQGEGTPLPTSTGAWINHTADFDPTAVDDLWHATINGRGQMYLATSAAETAAKLRDAFNAIIADNGAQGGIAVSTVNLSRGDSRAYFGTYNPAGWAGDLTANPIDPKTAEVDTNAAWSAGALLRARDWTTRVIAAGKAGTAVPFTAGNVGSLVNPGGVYGVDAEVVTYLRGDRTHEGSKFRSRTSLVGAVINSEPMVDRDAGIVYVQSGEGMLHAIDTVGADAGQELWAFVPESALSQIGATTARTYAFRTKLDGSPVVAKLSGGSKILVAGAGVAGRSFYALDVTSPRGLNETGLAAKHRWTFPASGDATTRAKMGDAMGRPLVVRSADGDVVLLTSGFNNTHDGKGRLWVLNASTGSVIHEFTVAAGALGAESGLTHVSGFLESDGSVRYVYGGDLLGNVWRFDLTDKTTADKLAVLKGPAGDLQPVTAAPELVLLKGRRIVLVGTGRLLDIGDFGSTKVQSFYAIADGATLASARSGLVARTYNPATDALSGATVDWAADRGWYLDLPSGQQANSRPTLAYGAVAFVTNANGGSDCAASSRLWIVDLLSGGAFEGTDYVSSVISDTANSSGVTALLTADGKVIGSGQDADGRPWQRDITDASMIAPAKNAWRELRRQ